MASIQFSSDPSTPSHINLGETPVTKSVTISMGHRTEQALVDLVNERRAILTTRTGEGTAVAEPVKTVEEALLDAIGGIGAAGGSAWFRQNFLNAGDLLHLQLQAIDLAIGGFFEAAQVPSDPTPHIEQLHWIAKKMLRHPIRGVQYAFAEEPPQPEGVTEQRAFARATVDEGPPPSLERAKRILEHYREQEATNEEVPE